MPTTEEILKDRGQRYGDFDELAGLAQCLKGLLKEAAKRSKVHVPPVQAEALDLICTKLARIVTGDPTYDDNWRDISGYAVLVINHLNPTPLHEA